MPLPRAETPTAVLRLPMMAGWCAGCLAICPTLAPAAENLSVFDPVTPTAASIRDLFLLVLAISGGILLLVEGLILYCVWRFRRRPAATSEPPQIYGSQPIEVAWTVAPLLIVFVIFLVVVRSVTEVRGQAAPDKQLRVIVIGHQWWWEYHYPDLGVRTVNELHLPADEGGEPLAVMLELEAVDVIHSYWVPRLAGKTDMIPGRTNRLWFHAPPAGEYHGQCAEYCGAQHANMKLLVVSQPAEDFAAWQAAQLRPAVDDPQVAAGRERFLALACVNCHTVRGTTAAGTFGPDLTHLMSRRTLAAGACVNDRQHLLRWLADPDSIKPGSHMPNMQLSPSDVESIGAYLLTLE